MFWSALGVGALLNTADEADGSRLVGQMQQQSLQSLRARFVKSARKTDGPAVEDLADFDVSERARELGMPDYPEESASQYQAMQREHRQERTAAIVALQREVAQLKDEFFEEHHYEAECNDLGEASLVLNEDGSPRVVDGGEEPEEKGVRERFEKSIIDKVLAEQEDEKEAFLAAQRHEIMAYLRSNIGALGETRIRGMLVRMIAHVIKAAFCMQQRHENAMWRAALPPVPEIAAVVEEGSLALREADKVYLEEEEKAPEAKVVTAFEEEMTGAIGELRARLREERRDEFFLLAPREYMRSGLACVDLAELFPPYLLDILYSLGIYAVEDE